jgi:hypothetical protein
MLRQAFFNPALFLVGFTWATFSRLCMGNNFAGHDNIIGKISVKDRERACGRAFAIYHGGGARGGFSPARSLEGA